MLVVTIEIHPFGDETKKRTLSKVTIGNIAGNKSKNFERTEYGTYTVKLIESDSMIDLPQFAYINNFHRDRGHLALVREALLELDRVE